MPPSTWKKSPPELATRFAAAIPEHSAIVRKPMFGYPAAFANGNMVCGLFQDSVVVRLGKEGAARAISELGAAQFSPMPGRNMTGYVLVPSPDVQDPFSLAVWLQRALDFTLTLPKKPAKSAPDAKANRASARKQ
jgi:TfoX/Sxy family transcriptional regulator of competence genes